MAQGAALAAIAAAEWPRAPARAPPSPGARYVPEATTIDLRAAPILPERPDPVPVAGSLPPHAGCGGRAAAPRLRHPTARTTLASIVLLDSRGRILAGPHEGMRYIDVAEVTTALRGAPATVLRRNGAYRQRYAVEWLSRASDLRIHHVRPIIVDGRVVGALLLSRSPRALFRGLYEDRGKILFGIGAIFAALVLLSALLSRGIARPIERLSQATRDVARGGGRRASATCHGGDRDPGAVHRFRDDGRGDRAPFALPARFRGMP